MAERFSSFCNSTTTAQWGGSIFKIATESLFLCSEFFIEKSDAFEFFNICRLLLIKGFESKSWWISKKNAICALFTGKAFSEALILASTNPQYDKRLWVNRCKNKSFWQRFTCIILLQFISDFFSTFDVWISSVKQMVAEFCKKSSRNSFWNFSQNSDWNSNRKSSRLHLRNFSNFSSFYNIGKVL